MTSELEHLGDQADASFVELRPLGHPIMDAMLTGFTTDALESAFQSVVRADGISAVTPAFNASFSGLFKSFFDVLPEQSLSDMPVLIGATGGTERHSLVLEHALRPMFSYLHAIVSPRAVYAATSDFGSQGALPWENVSPPLQPTSSVCSVRAARGHDATWSTKTSPPCSNCWAAHPVGSEHPADLRFAAQVVPMEMARSAAARSTLTLSARA
ncbi:CE1759 family FMN reductase [Streptomyces brevispora]|uniref:CE1759 family FMN reductase n=1 Tax=Streptomyces brevispora TaxID=887462 RepID=UPI0035DD849C